MKQNHTTINISVFFDILMMLFLLGTSFTKDTFSAQFRGLAIFASTLVIEDSITYIKANKDLPISLQELLFNYGITNFPLSVKIVNLLMGIGNIGLMIMAVSTFFMASMGPMLANLAIFMLILTVIYQSQVQWLYNKQVKK